MIFLIFVLTIGISLTISCPLKSVNSQSGCYCGIEIDGSTYIECRPNSTSIFPKFVRSFVYEKLNISSNKIRFLPSGAFDQLKVRKIFFTSNPLEKISEKSFDSNVLNYLEELEIGANENVPIDFLCHGNWKKLRVLRLNGFNLSSLDRCLKNMSTLKIFRAERTSFPENVSSFLENSSIVEFSMKKLIATSENNLEENLDSKRNFSVDLKYFRCFFEKSSLEILWFSQLFDFPIIEILFEREKKIFRRIETSSVEENRIVLENFHFEPDFQVCLEFRFENFRRDKFCVTPVDLNSNKHHIDFRLVFLSFFLGSVGSTLSTFFCFFLIHFFISSRRTKPNIKIHSFLSEYSNRPTTSSSIITTSTWNERQIYEAKHLYEELNEPTA